MGKRSGSDLSKITTMHGNTKLSEEESERITKLIEDKVTQVQILFSAFQAGLRHLDLTKQISLLTDATLEAKGKTFTGLFLRNHGSWEES